MAAELPAGPTVNPSVMDKDTEIERLRRLVGAYEKLTAFSHRELLDADRTIRAQETVQEISSEEIRDLRQQIDDLRSGEHVDLRIREILNEDQANEELILEQLERLRENSDQSFLVDLFKVLVHHEFDADEAKRYWSEILDHARQMQELLGRPVGFRVALLDFFVNRNRILKNPMIIEIALFDEMLKNSLLDELTQVYNRRYFDRSFMREINRARRHGTEVSLFVFDVDDFKQYNDQNGHVAGDVVLHRVGELLLQRFRQEDIPCRYGGEEFVVIMPETNTPQALTVAARFFEDLRSAPFDGGQVTISGGIAHYPDHGQDAGTIFLQADRCLYRAKRHGKNRIYIPSQENESAR